MYKHYFKRPLDIILSLLALIVLSPILLVIALLVLIKMGRPILFKQARPGLNEHIFTIYKFRTMSQDKDENNKLLSDSQRLTKFGRFLRSTSLDELPELFNIIKGDMSIVGPRPLLVQDMAFMSLEQRRRHNIRPGLTGLAQVNGRNNATWEDKLSLDLKYLYNIIFVNDCSIIFLTVTKVFKKNDISTMGMDTSENLGEYLLRVGKLNENEYKEIREELNRLIYK